MSTTKYWADDSIGNRQSTISDDSLGDRKSTISNDSLGDRQSTISDDSLGDRHSLQSVMIASGTVTVYNQW